MKNTKLFLITILFLAACAVPATPAPTLTFTSAPIPTFTSVPTLTFTPEPTATQTPVPSPTATPTPQLPVMLGTPLSVQTQTISASNAASLRLLGIYSGEPAGIKVVSADGKYAFFANSEGLEIFDLERQKMLTRLDAYMRHAPFGYLIGWLSVSRDGKVIGLVAEDSIKVLSFDGKVLYSLPDRQNEEYPYIEAMDGIGISPDGKLAAIVECAAGEYDDCPFQVVRTDSGETVYTWDHHMLNLHGSVPVFSPDGSLLATWFDNTLWFWSTADWSAVSKLWIGGYELPSWVFSPDGHQIAVGRNGILQVWDVVGHKLIREFKADTVSALYPFYSSDGQWLAGKNWGGGVAVWNVAEGVLVQETTLPVTDVALMRLSDGKVESIKLPGHDISLWGDRVGYDGFQFVQQDGQPKLAMLQRNQGCLLALNGLAQCKEGEYLLLSSNGDFYRGSQQGNVTEFRRGLDGSGEKAFSLFWSGYIFNPAGFDFENGILFYTLWSGPNSATAKAMDTSRGTTIGTWNNGWLSRIAYSNDGKYAAFFVSHNPGNELVLFDRSNRLAVYRKTYPGGIASAGVSFSPDSQKMALLVWNSAKQATVVEIMDVAWPHKTAVLSLTLPKDVFPLSKAFSPDGNLLAVSLSDGRILLVNLADGSVVYEWSAYRDWATELAFSPDGRLLASADMNGYVKLWGVWP